MEPYELWRIVIEYLQQFPDEERHPLVADNDDWAGAMSALASLEALMDATYQPVLGSDADVVWKTACRAMFEVMYCQGYNRGIEDASGF